MDYWKSVAQRRPAGSTEFRSRNEPTMNDSRNKILFLDFDGVLHRDAVYLELDAQSCAEAAPYLSGRLT